jgi:hypothetical protein
MTKTPVSYEAPTLTTFGSVEQLTRDRAHICKATSGPKDGLFTHGNFVSDCS